MAMAHQGAHVSLATGWVCAGPLAPLGTAPVVKGFFLLNLFPVEGTSLSDWANPALLPWTALAKGDI